MKTLVLERSEKVGGCARSGEIVPEFIGPTLAHCGGSIDPDIAAPRAGARRRPLMGGRRRLRADARRPRAACCGTTTRGRRGDIRAFSPKDAERYPQFLDGVARQRRCSVRSAAAPPPSIDSPGAADGAGDAKAGRKFRALGKADAYRLLRWMPMPAADLVGEWFESEPLRATIAAGGILGSFSRAVVGGQRRRAAAARRRRRRTRSRAGWFVVGGPGALADALAAAARQAGAEIRTGAEVARIDAANGAASGVTLSTGEAIAARAVVSNADPKRTLLGLLDPTHLDPEFVRRVQNIRAHGTLAKINYAVSALPRFAGVGALGKRAGDAALSGRIRLAQHRRHRARVRRRQVRQDPARAVMELTIPSLAEPSMAPVGSHVVSIDLQ